MNIWKIIGIVFIFRIISVLPMHIKYMRNMRATKKYKDILFGDNEKVINAFYVDKSERILDYLLEISRWIMGIFLLWVLFTYPKTNFSINRNNIIFTSFLFLASILSIILAGGFIGAGIIKPFWNIFATHRYYALSQKGVLYNGKIFHWQLFNSFSINEKHHYIYLWSANEPKIAIIIFTPESQDKMNTIIEIIRQYLPMNTHEDARSSKGSKINYLLPISITIPSLLVSMIFVINPIELSPLIISAIIVVHFYISYLIYKGMVPIDKLESAEIQ
jgi:hypothetical protein